jgi:hypothetical protein
MNQGATNKFVRVVAFGFAAVPFVFGALRALQTGTDVRYLVTALPSFAVAAMIFGIGTPRGAPRWLLSSVTLAGGTLLGAAVAFAQGATSATAVWVVTISFSLCSTASGALGLFARPRSS